MYSKRDISELSKMSITERKAQAMRRLKSSFDQASREGELRSRRVVTSQ
ncbi:hypothetical protein [Morganella psychrotolerans]|nr:hypothetical protein [Morganella psychrotolerans]